MKHNGLLFVLVILLASVASLSCSSDKSVDPAPVQGDFTLAFSETTLRSYPGGGGIAVIKLEPDSIFNEIVKVSATADTVLHAQLSDTTISKSYPIIELRIAPAPTSIDTFEIVVNCACGNLNRTGTITVIMYNVPGPVPTDFNVALYDFIGWLMNQGSDYLELGGMSFDAFRTDMGFVGSTCWTYWNSSWEIRICKPSTLDPVYNMRVRYRGEWNFRLAARKNADGSIVEMPL